MEDMRTIPWYKRFGFKVLLFNVLLLLSIIAPTVMIRVMGGPGSLGVRGQTLRLQRRTRIDRERTVDPLARAYSPHIARA